MHDREPAVCVRYRIKPDAVATNEALIRRVFEQVRMKRPDFRYTCVRFDDGVTFLHVFEPGKSGESLADLQAFRDFTADIKARCDELPVSTRCAVIGNYG